MQRPAELERAELIDGILQRYGGYTYSTLMEEDAEVLRVVAIAAMGAQDVSS